MKVPICTVQVYIHMYVVLYVSELMIMVIHPDIFWPTLAFDQSNQIRPNYVYTLSMEKQMPGLLSLYTCMYVCVMAVQSWGY